jgi:hypothetical protein
MANAVKPWLDQAGKFPIAKIGGIPHFNDAVLLDAPRTGVLHTTEGGWAGSLAIFKQHFAPHFMLGFDADEQKVRIAQLVQIGTIGAALKAHNNQAIVQIEMIGFSKETPWLPDDDTVAALASLMAGCNPHRSSGKFGNIAGWYGHGDCPSPDTHWDPGNLQWSVVLGKAMQMAAAIGVPGSTAAGPAAMARTQSATAAPKQSATAAPKQSATAAPKKKRRS